MCSTIVELAPELAQRVVHELTDSVFPGQSTFATALGGARIAAAIARER